MSTTKQCPQCGAQIPVYHNPVPTVDVIIYAPADRGVVLVQRRNPPFGWALPGGFVDYGESVEQAAVREAKEETGLDVHLTGLLGVYSSPDRDPRQHTLSVVFTAVSRDLSGLRAGDDAKGVEVAALADLPELAFDHAWILADFQRLGQGEGAGESIAPGRSLCSGE